MKPEHPQDETPDAPDASPTPLGPDARGVEVIAHFVRRLPFAPGVYRMLDGEGNVLESPNTRRARLIGSSDTPPNLLSQ